MSKVFLLGNFEPGSRDLGVLGRGLSPSDMNRGLRRWRTWRGGSVGEVAAEDQLRLLQDLKLMVISKRMRNRRRTSHVRWGHAET